MPKKPRPHPLRELRLALFSLPEVDGVTFTQRAPRAGVPTVGWTPRFSDTLRHQHGTRQRDPPGGSHLRIPTEVVHLIRSKRATDSEGTGPPIPRKWVTRSDRSGRLPMLHLAGIEPSRQALSGTAPVTSSPILRRPGRFRPRNVPVDMGWNPGLPAGPLFGLRGFGPPKTESHAWSRG